MGCGSGSEGGSGGRAILDYSYHALLPLSASVRTASLRASLPRIPLLPTLLVLPIFPLLPVFPIFPDRTERSVEEKRLRHKFASRDPQTFRRSVHKHDRGGDREYIGADATIAIIAARGVRAYCLATAVAARSAVVAATVASIAAISIATVFAVIVVGAASALHVRLLPYEHMDTTAATAATAASPTFGPSSVCSFSCCADLVANLADCMEDAGEVVSPPGLDGRGHVERPGFTAEAERRWGLHGARCGIAFHRYAVAPLCCLPLPDPRFQPFFQRLPPPNIRPRLMRLSACLSLVAGPGTSARGLEEAVRGGVRWPERGLTFHDATEIVGIGACGFKAGDLSENTGNAFVPDGEENNESEMPPWMWLAPGPGNGEGAGGGSECSGNSDAEQGLKDGGQAAAAAANCCTECRHTVPCQDLVATGGKSSRLVICVSAESEEAETPREFAVLLLDCLRRHFAPTSSLFGSSSLMDAFINAHPFLLPLSGLIGARVVLVSEAPRIPMMTFPNGLASLHVPAQALIEDPHLGVEWLDSAGMFVVRSRCVQDAYRVPSSSTQLHT